MRTHLLNLLNAGQLHFEHLAYVYVKKKAQLRKDVKVVTWDQVNQPLEQVLVKMLKVVLEKVTDDDCYLGQYHGTPIALPQQAYADVPENRRTTPLVTVLNEVVSGTLPLVASTTPGQPSDPLEPYRNAMKLIAWKYLVQNHSQTSVLCLITFKASFATGQQRFVFFTQANLEDERPEAMIDDATGLLRAELLQNVFEAPSLLKGALYPWLNQIQTQLLYSPTHLWVHNQRHKGQEVQYWPKVLECNRPKLSAASERAGLFTVVREAVRETTGYEVVPPRVFSEIVQEAHFHPELEVGHVVSAASRAGVDLPEETVKRHWTGQFKTPTYRLNAPKSISGGNSKYEVIAGNLRIPGVSPDLLDRMKVVTLRQGRFLLIPVEGPVQYKSHGSEPAKLPERELQDLDEITGE